MPDLQILSPAKINFNDASRTVWMQKNGDEPLMVRKAVPGEEMISGEVAKQGYVAILHPNPQYEKPLYCMTEEEFRAESIATPENPSETIAEEPTLWYVEAHPKRVYIVPDENGPFHLAAPAAWNADKDISDEVHPGWDVGNVFKIETGDERGTIEGYPVVETSNGPIYDREALESGSYQVVPAPK